METELEKETGCVMDVYLARQPIFDQKRNIYAYELLFRGGMSNAFPNIDGNSATSRLLSNTFFTTGIETVTGGKKAFINFTRELIIKRTPLLFSPKTTVIEILEDVEPDEEVENAIREMFGLDYTIALDDFTYHPKFDRLIRMSSIIKVDFRLSDKETIRQYAKTLPALGVSLLAEKVETNEEFQEAIELGFTYFQGYFFSKPQMMSGKDIPSLKINLIQILAEINSGNFHVQQLNDIIERDVGISYKLLSYMNSPFFRRSHEEIASIKQAIKLLGERGLKQFLSVIVMAELSSDKPSELIKSSVVRARICEAFGKMSRSNVDTSELFTLGLFSLIDAILDTPMEEILKRLPLAEEIKQVLTGKENILSKYLEMAKCYERGDWESALVYAENLGISEEGLPECYLEAISWADALFES